MTKRFWLQIYIKAYEYVFYTAVLFHWTTLLPIIYKKMINLMEESLSGLKRIIDEDHKQIYT